MKFLTEYQSVVGDLRWGPTSVLIYTEGKPNLEAREDIKITDPAPILRAVEGEPGAGELVRRRWSWPGQNGKPVYNFRSDGREFTSGRCLIPADGFYEFTDAADKKKRRKDKWLFTKTGEPWFCIAGIWRSVKDVGEAFTMLTMPPAPTSRPTTTARSPSSVAAIGPLGLIRQCQPRRS
jgi:putative SOS response-associated peptidase YedK